MMPYTTGPFRSSCAVKFACCLSAVVAARVRRVGGAVQPQAAVLISRLPLSEPMSLAYRLLVLSIAHLSAVSTLEPFLSTVLSKVAACDGSVSALEPC